jgi:hypothetical protein
VRKCIAVMFCLLLASSVFARLAQSRRTTSPPPKALVAALGGRLAVLNSADVRASYVSGQFTGVSSIAVTADGRFIMVGPKDCEKNWIEQVEIATGAVEDFVGAADSPVVNAKGLVAYGVRCDGHSLGFTDILTGQNARRDPFGETVAGRPSSAITGVRPLAWLSDGRTLFYEVTIRGEKHPRYYFGRVWPLVEANEEVVSRVAGALQQTGPDPTAAALVDDKTIAFAQNYAAGSRVRVWDVFAERFLGAGRSFQLPETITALQADPSGNHFLAVTASGVLYRWSVGDRAPARLADDVSAAAWIP